MLGFNPTLTCHLLRRPNFFLFDLLIVLEPDKLVKKFPKTSGLLKWLVTVDFRVVRLLSTYFILDVKFKCFPTPYEKFSPLFPEQETDFEGY